MEAPAIRVLIIEDKRDVQLYLAHLLQTTHGYDAMTAGNITEGLDLACFAEEVARMVASKVSDLPITFILFITKKIVEQRGGTIEVTSKPRQGSCFTITLPKMSLRQK